MKKPNLPITKCLICGAGLFQEEESNIFCCKSFGHFYFIIKYNELHYLNLYLEDVGVQACFHFGDHFFIFRDKYQLISDRLTIPDLNWNNKKQVINKLKLLLTYI
jgi:hypothetical protein